MTNHFRLEMKKDALRQNQDGSYKITFNVHPQDMDAALLMAAMGTRYYAELIDAEAFDNQGESGLPAPAKKDTIVTRAVLLCKDPVFQEFLKTEYPTLYNKETPPEQEARDMILHICHINSRSELLTDDDAADAFRKMESQFRMWRDYEYQQE